MQNPRTILLSVLGIIAVTVIVFLVFQYVNLQNNLNDPNYLLNLQTEQQSNSRERIMSRLASIMLLPDEVNPKIATISNIDELRSENPEFYKNAINGDTLVLYSELAIVYRDSVNKIINIAPILQEGR